MQTPSSYRLAARLLAVALAGAAAALLALPELPSAGVPSALLCVVPAREVARSNAGRSWRIDALLIVVRVATGEPADPGQGAIIFAVSAGEERRTRPGDF